jgi:beta-mannosidase
VFIEWTLTFGVHLSHKLRVFIGNYFKLPSHGGVDRFEDLVYLSQVIQAMAMKVETEFYRRNREVDPKTGNGNTMGALYWQLNDIWQGTTWASIEYGGKWKLLQSYANDFFSNQLVTAYEDTNETLKVLCISCESMNFIHF